MKFETILSAYSVAHCQICRQTLVDKDGCLLPEASRWFRQRTKFRERLVARVAELEGYIDAHNQRMLEGWDKMLEESSQEKEA